MPIQCARAVSNIDTNTSPTSWRAHSSKTSIRNRPYASRPDRAVGDEVALLPVQRPVAGAGAPARLGQRQQLGRHPLDDRDELHERRAQVVAQEPVDLAPVVAVGRVHRGQRVPVDAVPLERVEPADHPVEGGLAALVDPVGVVHLARPVDRDPDQEVVLLQERAPLVVEQGRVGLHRVEDPLTGRRVLPLELQRAAEEVEPHQRRLAALERDDHLVDAALGGEQLGDVRLVHVGRHPEPAARVQLVLGQEEAVLAVQVADRAGGLGHHVEGPRCRQCRHRGPSVVVGRSGRRGGSVEDEPASHLGLVVDGTAHRRRRRPPCRWCHR